MTRLKALPNARVIGARFGTLLDPTPDSNLVVNSIPCIVLVNSLAEVRIGNQAGELLGKFETYV